MSAILTPDPVYPGEEATSREALLTLCHALEAAGMWLYLQDATTLIAGPPELVHRRPDLLTQLRTHKDAILRLLQDNLAVGTSLRPSPTIRALRVRSVLTASAPA
jgi:hypothetical protein